MKNKSEIKDFVDSAKKTYKDEDKDNYDDDEEEDDDDDDYDDEDDDEDDDDEEDDDEDDDDDDYDDDDDDDDDEDDDDDDYDDDDDDEEEDYGGSVIAKILNITEKRPKEIEKVVPVQVTLEVPKTNFKSAYTKEDYLKRGKKDFSSAPTFNQIRMYLGAGVYYDDGADGDNQQTYTVDGREYHAGLWVMKKEFISGFSEGKAKKRGDTDNDKKNCWHRGRPTASEIGKYFFLPAAGYYDRGRFYSQGSDGRYWSSDSSLYFSSFSAYVFNNCGYGLLMVAE